MEGLHIEVCNRVATWSDMSYCPIDIALITNTSGSGSVVMAAHVLPGWILGGICLNKAD